MLSGFAVLNVAAKCMSSILPVTGYWVPALVPRGGAKKNNFVSVHCSAFLQGVSDYGLKRDWENRCALIPIINAGTTPITIWAVNSDHGLSFAGEETWTMV